MQYHLEDWSNQRIDYPRLPGCSTCRPASVEMGYVEPAVVYEDSVAFPSRHLLDPKDHQVHYRASNMELAHEGKRYPGNPSVKLPGREQLVAASGQTLAHLPGRDTSIVARRVLNVKALANLLLKGAGVRHDDGTKTNKLQRWSPTGGNLGSVELYVVAASVEGLEPGVYFYQPQNHTLAYLRRMEREEYERLLQEAILPDSGMQPDALILSVGAYHRVGHKYSTFAYRVINLDAGVALSQMHMVAHSLGIAAQTVQRWADDAITDLLDLEDIQEMVTAVLAVQGKYEG
ncbi:MAG: SagB family peptide dehydrogenase [Ktedonobacteraceae bacterium]|nr:SagB family peptide dehydrogenase [Ktedonobacteraceae bacterium]